MSGPKQPDHTSPPYRLASRTSRPEGTTVHVKDLKIGGTLPIIMAGPCAVESRDQIIDLAIAIRARGGQVLRGGAFKPRSSPYSFQGLGVEGLEYLAEASIASGLPVVSEVMEPELVDFMANTVDILQIGARNMQNYPLLRKVGRTSAAVLLKRGLSATIEEWLMSAEYILAEGNPNVILCERGIRTFETYTRNTLDLNAVPVVQSLSHLPVIVDPSHGIGLAAHVPAMSRAAIAAGAHGLLLEVHANPAEALSDAQQTVGLDEFAEIVASAQRVAASLLPPRVAVSTAAKG